MTSSSDALQLFALESSRPFGERVAEELGIELASHEERDFDDGEHKTRPLESVRGRDVFVLHSLYIDERQSANDKLCRFLFFLGACRDAGAASVTAVAPYLCYARKDRTTKSRDPVTTRYVAQIFESVGVDRMVVMDVQHPVPRKTTHVNEPFHHPARTLGVDGGHVWGLFLSSESSP